jgi:RNA polymerase sigma factor (sigma-70 family)
MTDEELIVKYIDMVRKISNEVYTNNPVYSPDDLVQIGCSRLIQAAKKYDESRGQMSTLLYLSVKRELLRYIKNNNKAKVISIVKDNSSSEPSDNIWEYLPSLSENDQKMIELKIKGFSQKEISVMLNISTNVVKNRLNNIYKKIRKANA